MSEQIKKYDMTEGSEWKRILFFSLPILAGNLLQQLYSTVDGIVSGNYINEFALSAIGSCSELAMFFIALAIGLSLGSGIMTAQYFGAGQESEMRKGVFTSIILILSIGIVFSVLAYIFTPILLGGLLDVSHEKILRYAITYFRIYSLGITFQFAYNIVAATLRAIGDSRATLYFLCVSSVLNILLDLLFVVVFGWGIAGAAFATIISQLASACVSAVYLFRKYPVFRFSKKEFVFDWSKCRLALKLGVPMTVQQSVVSFSHIAVQRLVNSFGPSVMAAFAAGSRIEVYGIIPYMSFNMGLSTFASQNMGAGKLDRVKRGHNSTIIMSEIVCVVLSVVLYAFAPALTGLFGVEGESHRMAVGFVRYMSYFFVFFGLYGVYTGTLQGAGDVMYSSFCTLSSLIFRVALAYLLIYVFGAGYFAIWGVMPAGWLFALIAALIRYYRGGWKSKGIV